MSPLCRWVHCGRPIDGRGWWCADHAARLAAATTTLDAEPRDEDH